MKSKRYKSQTFWVQHKCALILAVAVILTGIFFRTSDLRSWNKHIGNFKRRFKSGIQSFKELFQRKPKIKIYRKTKLNKENQVQDYEKIIMTYKTIEKFETSKRKREGGGFMVSRPIGDQIDSLDPFLMLDHLGPVVYGPGEAIGAPDHPHRGFETVTYVIDGGFHHQDSAGNSGNLNPGWVQWLTAGSGVVHSEMPTEKLLKDGGKFEGFQLWVNLPKKFKMIPPRYQDTPPEKIPVVKSQDGNSTIKVIAGTCLGAHATIETRIPIIFLDVKVEKGGKFDVEIPENFNCFAYVWRGSGSFGEKSATMGQVAIFSIIGDAIELKASVDEAMHVLVIGGQAINEPIARYGPFVMNTFDEIEQAFKDYRGGKLGQIDGSEERFAKTQSAVNQNKKTGNWNQH